MLTPASAADVGVTRAHVRTALARGHWRLIAPGVVLTRSADPERVDWAEAGLLLAGTSGALSGWDALRCKGIGDRTPPSAPVLVLTRQHRSRRVGGVLIRLTNRPYSRWYVHALADQLAFAPVVPPARAVADAALWLPRRDSVRALVASAVRNERCRLSDIGAELEAGPRNGSGHLRAALDEIRAGARSAAEAEAIAQLRPAPVPPFEVNVPVLDGRGRLVFVIDIFWRSLRAALEIDSREFHYTLADWEATLRKHNALTRHGLAVEHRPPIELREPGRPWLAEVAAWLSGRANELGAPYAPARGAAAVLMGPAAPYIL